MFPLLIWIAGILVEGLLLLRGWRSGLISKFPMFFCYVGLIFGQSLLLYFAARFHPTSYPDTYWFFEFVDVFAGCAVVLEISRTALAEFPGAAKLARNALLLVFSLTFGRVLLTAQEGALRWSRMMTIQLERDMRFIQIAAILTLLVLLFFYAIPTGRNLRGIFLGYGLFLGVNILNLTLMRRFGAGVQQVASYVQSLSYLFVLGLWTVSLWSLEPQPAQNKISERRAYDELYGDTQRRLGRTRSMIKGALDS